MNNSEIKILVIEDDVQIRNYINFILKQEGFDCIMKNNATEGLSVLLTNQVNLILLDLGLPDIDGQEVIKKIREWSNIPIIVVSARDQDKEKVNALDLGADDYITKPFSGIELLARIRVSIRHINIESNINQTYFSVDNISIDLDKRLAYKNNKELHLTPLEYSLLSVFFKNIGKVLTTQFIIKEVYGYNYGTDTQALRALVVGLRRKIEDIPAKPKFIVTEIGVGYRLVDNSIK